MSGTFGNDEIIHHKSINSSFSSLNCSGHSSINSQRWETGSQPTMCPLSPINISVDPSITVDNNKKYNANKEESKSYTRYMKLLQKTNPHHDSSNDDDVSIVTTASTLATTSASTIASTTSTISSADMMTGSRNSQITSVIHESHRPSLGKSRDSSCCNSNNSRDISSSSNKTNPSCRTITFGEVRVREHDRILVSPTPSPPTVDRTTTTAAHPKRSEEKGGGVMMSRIVPNHEKQRTRRRSGTPRRKRIAPAHDDDDYSVWLPLLFVHLRHLPRSCSLWAGNIGTMIPRSLQHWKTSKWQNCFNQAKRTTAIPCSVLHCQRCNSNANKLQEAHHHFLRQRRRTNLYNQLTFYWGQYRKKKLPLLFLFLLKVFLVSSNWTNLNDWPYWTATALP